MYVLLSICRNMGSQVKKVQLYAKYFPVWQLGTYALSTRTSNGPTRRPPPSPAAKEPGSRRASHLSVAGARRTRRRRGTVGPSHASARRLPLSLGPPPPAKSRDTPRHATRARRDASPRLQIRQVTPVSLSRVRMMTCRGRRTF
jgi:hypothetical protein